MPPRRKKPTKVREPLISKSILAKAITDIIKERGLTQSEASFVVRGAPSHISLITSGKVDGFSPERLIRILSRSEGTLMFESRARQERPTESAWSFADHSQRSGEAIRALRHVRPFLPTPGNLLAASKSSNDPEGLIRR
jgi:predicted XRE-type DNA-binding protein